MPTCKNCFHGIVDQQSVLMVRNLDWESPILSSKTAGKNTKQLSVRASLCAWRARDKRRCRKPVVTVFRRVHFTSGLRSRHRCSQSWVTLSGLVFAFFLKGETSRSLDDVIMKRKLEPYNSWEPEIPPHSPHDGFRGVTAKHSQEVFWCVSLCFL